MQLSLLDLDTIGTVTASVTLPLLQGAFTHEIPLGSHKPQRSRGGTNIPGFGFVCWGFGVGLLLGLCSVGFINNGQNGIGPLCTRNSYTVYMVDKTKFS